MIEIKKVSDTEVARKICAVNGLEWRPDHHVIATIDHGEVLQCAVFSYEKETGEILVIEGFDGEIALLDGLCRAILNIMDINGVKDVYLSKKYGKIAEYVGFKPHENGYHLALEGFFKCGCCK